MSTTHDLSPLLRCPTEIQEQIFNLVMDLPFRIDVDHRFHRFRPQGESYDHHKYIEHYGFACKDHMLEEHLAYMNLCRTIRPIVRRAYFRNNTFAPMGRRDPFGDGSEDGGPDPLWRPLLMVEGTALSLVRSIYIKFNRSYVDGTSMYSVCLERLGQLNAFEALHEIGVDAKNYRALARLRGTFGILKASIVTLHFYHEPKNGPCHKGPCQRTFDLSLQHDVRTAAGLFFGLNAAQKVCVRISGLPGYVKFIAKIGAHCGIEAYFAVLNGVELLQPRRYYAHEAIEAYEQAIDIERNRVNGSKHRKPNRRWESGQIIDLAESLWLWATDASAQEE